MRKLYFIFILLCTFNATAQQLHVDWNKFYGGDSCHCIGRGASGTGDGGMLLLGYTTCNDKGDVPPLASYLQNDNLSVAKVDNNGQLIWLKVFGGSDNEEAISACETSDGGYAILGTTKSSDGDVDSLRGATDLWLLKLDAAGNLLWQKTFGSPFSEKAMSVIATENNELLLFGGSNGAGGDIPFHNGGQFTFDWIVIKTDSAGNKKWCKVYGGSDGEDNIGKLVCIGDSYYIASASNSTDLDCYDTSWFGSANTDYNYHLLKLDTSGTVLWDKSYGGSLGEGAYDAVFDARDSSIVMVGPTYSADYMIDNPQHLSTMWVLKTDLNGTPMWSKSLNMQGISNYTHSHIEKTAFGYLVIGNIAATIPIPGITNMQAFCIDTTGDELVSKLWGGTKHDFLEGVFVANNTIYAGGSTTAPPFTEGANSGQQGFGRKFFFSKLDFWPVSVKHTVREKKLIKAYPNPAKDKLNIQFPAKGGSLSIRDMKGRIVFERKIAGAADKIDVDIASWSNGNYLVQWQSEYGEVLTEKVVVVSAD
jgi:hypothetical protein